MDERFPHGSDLNPDDRTIIQRRGSLETTLKPGAVLANTYVLETLLGRSPMGEVYRARHVELGTRHVIKVIQPSLTTDPRLVASLVEEARKLRDVRHPAVVGYEGLFRDDQGLRYLVLEFVEGFPLRALLAGRRLEPDEVLRLADRLADGLAAVHGRGIIHRDLSPDNIIVPDGEVGRAKLTEFGFAKSADAGDSTLIGVNFAARFAYASPEQLGLFGGRVDSRADLYSLGLVLGAAAIGFGNGLEMGSRFPAAIAARQKLPDLSPLPPTLRPIIAPLLQPRPEDRPASIRAWQAAVKAADVSSDAAARHRSPRLVRVLVGGAAGVLVAVSLAAAILLLPRISNPSISVGDLRARFSALRSSYECAELSLDVGPDSSMRVSGNVASEADADRLRREVYALANTRPAGFDVGIIGRPHCEVAALLAPLSEPGHRDSPTVAFSSKTNEAHIGERLALEIQTPGFDSYVYVDYFDSGGQVLHLFPNGRDRFNYRPWRNRFILFKPPLRSCWAFSGNIGRELITVIAAAKPLITERPADIESATDYLDALAQRINRTIPDKQAAALLFFELKGPLPWASQETACPAR